jgi:hypothetical protein
LKEDIQSKNKNNENTTQKTEKTKSNTTKTGDEPKDDKRRPPQKPAINLGADLYILNWKSSYDVTLFMRQSRSTLFPGILMLSG